MHTRIIVLPIAASPASKRSFRRRGPDSSGPSAGLSLPPRPNAHRDDGADGARVFLDRAQGRSRVQTALEARDNASCGGHSLGDFLLRHSCGATGGHQIGDEQLQRSIRLELARAPVRVPDLHHQSKMACQALVARGCGSHDDLRVW